MTRKNHKEYRVYFPDEKAAELDAIAAQAGIRTSDLISQVVRAFFAANLPLPGANQLAKIAPSAAPTQTEPHLKFDDSRLKQGLEPIIATLVQEQQQTRRDIARLFTENQVFLDEFHPLLALLPDIFALASLTRREVEALILAGEHILLDVALPEEKLDRKDMADSIKAELTRYAIRLGIETPPTPDPDQEE